MCFLCMYYSINKWWKQSSGIAYFIYNFTVEKWRGQIKRCQHIPAPPLSHIVMAYICPRVALLLFNATASDNSSPAEYEEGS